VTARIAGWQLRRRLLEATSIRVLKETRSRAVARLSSGTLDRQVV
jgi:hypothetical protein